MTRATNTNLSQLTCEFETYCEAQGLPMGGDALEIVMFNRTISAAQRAWLNEFIDRWGRAQAEAAE